MRRAVGGCVPLVHSVVNSTQRNFFEKNRVKMAKFEQTRGNRNLSPILAMCSYELCLLVFDQKFNLRKMYQKSNTPL